MLLQTNEIFVAPCDRAEFDSLHTAIAAEFAPASEFQRQCAKTILHSLWTIRRTRILEAHLQEKAFGAHGLEGLLLVESSKQFKDVLSLRRQAERSYAQALKDFRADAASRTTTETPEPPAKSRPKLKLVASNGPNPPRPAADQPPLPGENPQFVDQQWPELPLAG